MTADEIALQLTMKAMEHGLFFQKPLNMFAGDNPWEAANQYTVKQVNDFYQETKRRLLNA